MREAVKCTGPTKHGSQCPKRGLYPGKDGLVCKKHRDRGKPNYGKPAVEELAITK